jgi:GxxExxY protein
MLRTQQPKPFNYEIRESREMKTDILFKDESYAIIGACFEVYKTMGCGYLENVYQECLAIEFTSKGIPFVEQPRLHLEFKGITLKQTYQPDFICFDGILLEIKSVKSLIDEFRAQTVNYLKATHKQLALLVNFGHYPKLEYERFLNDPLSRISRIS